MLKMVCYNGENESYYSCSSPTELSKGKIYEVIDIIVKGYQTNYVLKGVDGEFNSVWFNDVMFKGKVYIAVSNEIPKEGERYNCKKIKSTNEKVELIKVRTSIIKSVTYIGNSVYSVNTSNSVYIVKVN